MYQSTAIPMEEPAMTTLAPLSTSTTVSAAVRPSPRLLDQLLAAASSAGHSTETANTMVDYCRRYVLFHGKRHPRELGLAEVGQYLQHIAATVKNPVQALDAARCGLDFLYGEVLHLTLGELPLPRPPLPFDQIRQVVRVRHNSKRTEECYVQWAKRYILFHHKRHPRDMGVAEVELFLTHLAVEGNVSASTQNQALSALLFLYRDVMGMELGRFDAVRARQPKRLPMVLALIEGADGAFALMARLLYGCGLRLMECCRLRVKDIDLLCGQIMVRQGKGAKDRVVMLPKSVRGDLEKQLIQVLWATRVWRRR
jgi:hypothetical protein